MFRSVGRWWAGLWVWSGSDEIILRRDCEGRTVSCHSMKAAKSSGGPSSDDSALQAVFRLVL